MTSTKESVFGGRCLLLSLLLVLAPVGYSSQSALVLGSVTELSTEGFLTLRWHGDAELPVILQLSTDPDFLVLQRQFTLNAQTQQKEQVHITGFGDGIYYARLLNGNDGPISNVFRFQVVHRNLTAAWMIFAIGAALFALLIAVVVRYARKDMER